MAGRSMGSAILARRRPAKRWQFWRYGPCEAALELARGVDLMVHETTLEQAMAEKPIAAVIRRASRQRRWPAMPASVCLSLPILVRAMTRKAVCACWRSVGTCFPDAAGRRLYGVQPELAGLEGIKQRNEAKNASPSHNGLAGLQGQRYPPRPRRLHQRSCQLHNANQRRGHTPSTRTSSAEISTTIPPALYCQFDGASRFSLSGALRYRLTATRR